LANRVTLSFHCFRASPPDITDSSKDVPQALDLWQVVSGFAISKIYGAIIDRLDKPALFGYCTLCFYEA
jgi:hypothetical protein